ncbi:class I SAM-dependent methyltransferase [Ruegeria arenilitoris]|uniref:class I SAM-dependent methyltransferase n=1 Tax=Ruegeria arenilitoris TaxID=1173585 RepID=UPI001480A219|nr:class I SAM-dependent methyltransferase [Ruegeria arenilitoris]
MPKSPITGQVGTYLFEAKVIGHHSAKYYLDNSCGYIWVENPTWLEEAYSDAIALTDTGIVARNLKNTQSITQVMRANRLTHECGVDLGGGYGLLVRGLRDSGLDFHWSDPYARNLLARGFEAVDKNYAVATAFEVLEHLPNPLDFLTQARARYGFDTLFFSATCFDPHEIPHRDWWYWAFETGQHISFFSEKCLDYMAVQLGMRKVHLRGDIYAFTILEKLRWPGRLQRRILDRKHRRVSLTQKDYEDMKQRVIDLWSGT